MVLMDYPVISSFLTITSIHHKYMYVKSLFTKYSCLHVLKMGVNCNYRVICVGGKTSISVDFPPAEFIF